MPQYRRMIEWSANTLIDPSEYIREQTNRMQQAAADLRFEVAGKIKVYIEHLLTLGKGAFRFVAKLSDFQYLSFQQGPRPDAVKVFLVSAGEIREILGIIDESIRPAEVMRLALSSIEAMPNPVALEHAERIGIVTHHLFSPKATQGVFLAMSKIDEKSISKAIRDLRKQKVQEESDEEGVVKELQAM